MDDLIEALTIFRKYANPRWPTVCSHDQLAICGVTRDQVSEEDIGRLNDLGFFWDESDEIFVSFRFGSA